MINIPTNMSSNQMIYVACFVVITLVCVYFLLVWQIKEVVKDEFAKRHEVLENNRIKKRKKLMYLKQKRLQEQMQISKNTNANQTNTFEDFGSISGISAASATSGGSSVDTDIDLDSYIDPAAGYVSSATNANNTVYKNDTDGVGYSNDRLNRNDILARDIADGVR